MCAAGLAARLVQTLIVRALRYHRCVRAALALALVLLLAGWSVTPPPGWTYDEEGTEAWAIQTEHDWARELEAEHDTRVYESPDDPDGKLHIDELVFQGDPGDVVDRMIADEEAGIHTKRTSEGRTIADVIGKGKRGTIQLVERDGLNHLIRVICRSQVAEEACEKTIKSVQFEDAPVRASGSSAPGQKPWFFLLGIVAVLAVAAVVPAQLRKHRGED